MLNVKNLKVKVDDKEILNELSISFELGKNYALLGKNGSGKSSLVLTIMGHPKYSIEGGDIILDGNSIKELSPDKRAKSGIFLAFQKIPEIPGLKLFDFLKAIYEAKQEQEKPLSFLKFKKLILPYFEEVGLEKDFLFRDLNVGFSGGEKRKIEIIQLRLLKPKYIILDEIDSGLDINALKQLGDMIKKIDGKDNSFIIISHYFEILDFINIDEYIILKDGKIYKKGGKNILEKIKKDGF